MPVLPKTFNNNRFGKLPLFVVDSEHKCATTAATKNKWTFEDPGDIYIYISSIYIPLCRHDSRHDSPFMGWNSPCTVKPKNVQIPMEELHVPDNLLIVQCGIQRVYGDW